MNLHVSHSFPLSIKEQIIRQIKALIENRQLNHGDMLLSAKEMAIYLNINRNTVAGAYKDLATDGYLKIIKGSGTYVRKRSQPPKTAELKPIINRAFKEALSKGFSSREIVDSFVTQLLYQTVKSRRKKKIILIDCNYEVLNTLDLQIKQQHPVESHLTRIQDIQAFPDKFVKRASQYDLVLCGMNHIEELRNCIPDIGTPVIGFLIRTDFQIMNQIAQLPAGTTVGYCCISQKSAKAFFSSARFTSGTTLKRIHVGIDTLKQSPHIFDACDIVFATHYVFDTLAGIMFDTGKLVRVQLEIDPQNLAFILTQLQKEVYDD